jgi:hypothetical protein
LASPGLPSTLNCGLLFFPKPVLLTRRETFEVFVTHLLEFKKSPLLVWPEGVQTTFEGLKFLPCLNVVGFVGDGHGHGHTRDRGLNILVGRGRLLDTRKKRSLKSDDPAP